MLHNRIIGMADHPGLQGEIFMQGNIIYNFEKGNIFKHFKTDYLNYPFGENLGLGLANSLHLFMYIPLCFFFGIIESYNVLVIIIFLLNFLSAYLLARYLFLLRPVALCSALVFALNPYILLKMSMGFNQKCAVFWIPIYCLALFKLRDTRLWRYAFGTAFILSLIQMTYPPYAYYAIMLTMLSLSYLFLRRGELQFALSRFVFIMVLFIFFSSFVYYLMGFGLVYFEMFQPKLNTTLDGCLDLFKPFRFLPYHSSYYPTGLPLGISISAFVLGIVAFIKKRGLPRLIFFNLLLSIIIAAGSYLAYGGQSVQFLGHRIVLPFYFISKYLPFAGDIFFPIRIFPFINISLALLTGYGLSYFSSAVRKLKPSLIAILFLFIYLSELIILFPQLFPPHISEVNIPQFYRQIKNERFGAILNLPLSYNRDIINNYGYYAVLSGKKIMNPYNKNKFRIYLPKNTDNREAKKKFLDLLSAWNVGYVIVHLDFLKREVIGGSIDEFSWLKTFCESTIYPEDNLLVYKVPSFKQ